ncbi:MAG: hypothetical protein ACI8UR_000544 [Natronomonas sp.]|jgi:hypothetical protein|uniref:DUF6517 family protein n=1 Tax=Natronomonas sp. TaxID=2184060 RepID=UPI00398A1BE8
MRRIVAGLLCVLLVSTAGCAGIVSDSLTFEAGETLVDNQTAADAGYELESAETQVFNETASAGGQEVQVVAESHMARYQKAGEGTNPAAFGVITTPSASVAGQNLNPLLRLNETQLLKRVAGRENVSFERQGEYAVSPFGETTNVTVYRAKSEGEKPDAYVHIAQRSPPGTDDVVLAYATYPVATDDSERAAVKQLFSGLEHTSNSNETATPT